MTLSFITPKQATIIYVRRTFHSTMLSQRAFDYYYDRLFPFDFSNVFKSPFKSSVDNSYIYARNSQSHSRGISIFLP